MADEAATPASSVADEPTSSSSDEPSVSAMKKLMKEEVTDGGKKKSIWRMTMDTLSMADGKTQKADMLCDTAEEALKGLEGLVAEQTGEKWNFPYTPFDDFQATREDLLMCFCKWSYKDPQESKSEHAGKYNASKAFRRLTSYVDWIDEAAHRKKGACVGMLDEPLQADKFTDVAHALGMYMTHDANDHLVWWFDLNKMDKKAIKAQEITPKQLLRYCLWFIHIVMFDKRAQDNGMYFIEDLGNCGFFDMVTLFPNEVSTAFDRLTIGVLPVKMKEIRVMNSGTWMKVLITLMTPFMSKKMQQRFVLLREKDDPQALTETAVGGKEYILNGCCGLTGSLEQDIVFGTFIKQ